MKLTAEQLAARKMRQRATANMTHCHCGNVARLGETMCGRCLDVSEKVDVESVLRRRAEIAVAWLRECHTWMMENDLDMTCPMEDDPEEVADNLASALDAWG